VIDNPDFADELFEARAAAVSVEPARTVSAYFEYADGGHRSNVPFHRLSDLPQGAAIQGPAILADMTQTIVVEPECVARILKKHVIIDVEAGCDATTSATSAIGQANGCADMHVNGDGNDESELTPDPVTLAVFANRFMSIAEQMGVLFERTSISLSIKERLDFSCSIHTGDDGGLVANAPHIPIHLGSMADAVRNQHEIWKGRLEPVDVLLTNHPDLGGTHLPDITVVTPIFDTQDATKVLFYMASRGHHSDIGGSGVTSMNPVAKLLWEEGMVVKTLKMVRAGVFDEEAVTKLFMEAGEHPGCSATRRLDHNLTDLRAAVSANQRGATLMQGLFQEFGTGKVLFYMRHIQRIAAKTIRQFLRETFDTFGGRPLEAEDYYDDGTLVKLKITIDREEGSAVFDWTGTGPQTHGNFNVPISISYAAIICK
jgi:5-oxoprolinase (ATP-hydrolysing)